MSAILLLEKIGANASLRHNSHELVANEDIQKLIDSSPDIVAFIAPAEDDEEPSEDDNTPEKDDVNSIATYG